MMNRARPWRCQVFFKIFSIILLTVSLLAASGCFGRFPLTRAAYRFNVNVSENEFYQTLTFWGMTLGLVYLYTGFSDLFVLNVVEFWSDETIDLENQENQEFKSSNPMIDARINQDEVIYRPIPAPDAQPPLPLPPAGIMTLDTLLEDGQPIRLYLKRANSMEYHVLDERGNRTGLVRKTDLGEILLCTTEGDVISKLPVDPALLWDR